MEGIADVSKECEGQNKVEEILLWDVIKMEIRAAPFKYATARKRRFKHKEYLLEEEFLVLDKNRSTTVYYTDGTENKETTNKRKNRS